MRELLVRYSTVRWVFLYLGIFPIVMMLVAVFYFQHYLQLEPCPLCSVQRVFTIAIAVVAFIAFIHNPGKLGRRVYAAVALVPTLMGVGAAARHVWLQSLPPDQVPGCGPGLDYLMEVFSLVEALQQILMGSGECAEVVWRFLGLSIPAWTMVAFLMLMAVQIFQLLRKD